MQWQRSVQLLLLFTNISGIILVAGMDDVWVELRAPRFVVHRHNAVLKCEHNVDPESLYKVVFFKNGQRLMKFVRERDPQYEVYNVTGVEINLNTLSPTSVTLDRLDFTASGPYACEIALETPLYSKVSKIHELNVIDSQMTVESKIGSLCSYSPMLLNQPPSCADNAVPFFHCKCVRQKFRPKIKIKHKKLLSNEHLEATCQSAPAYPAPHLTWFINYMKVDERLTTPHGTVSVRRHHHGMPLFLTNSSLAFPLTSIQLHPNETLDITCLSTIPSYASLGEGFADVQNNTVTVNVVRNEPAPTQLPVKIVSSELNLSPRCHVEHILFVIVIIVCYINS